MHKIIFLLILTFCCNVAAANGVQQNTTADAASHQAVSSDPFFAAQGNYAIGTTFFTWNDSGNKYIGQIWYPAEYCATAKQASYLPESIYKTAWVTNNPMIASIRSLTTGAMIDAPLLGKQSRYPVLIYSPGLGSVGQAGTFSFEYLASRGFIVAAINHPGSSFFTERADGSLIPYNKTANYDTPDEKKAVTETRAHELSYALDALMTLNNTPTSVFWRKIDTANIGVFGHSIGGRSALRAASLDKRFKAAANLDGSLEDEPAYTFTNQETAIIETDPDEIIQSEIASGDTKPEEVPQIKAVYAKYMENLLNSGHAKHYLFYYKNTRHMNYTDMPILFPQDNELGSADGTKVLLSFSNLLEDFFNEAFSHPESSLEDKYFDVKLMKVKNNLH
ncbi:dienelactone hydrolase [Sporomusaceae bacterium BoRhaA]|uniref:alpha/beta hydrolase family protein n=1 Tax=Pelorhabdus rhamnosifermentans TaxID=2772457 RepID=UPI001C0607B2|nr:hypothetical protein [Pelorhabdus rhamnosifermentans]MBU2702322.1 dienelactone hydrolase [Pelorhabdus rhamnosifermentans]